ncbi:hypothetical protein CDL15_Pgr028923 [Punica granatum]|uniref:Replication factor-A protein 1 N-terminal domain-containing protein n=1 Tax=Punica granatum TaxID=22663 RepID=A0A218WXK4_PUNGR|nr:hypothetical protein CDL15_Pgr028923 [Punica granatum]
MPVNLTPNAIAAINGGDVNSKPLVQVLDIKLIGTTQERYRLLLSDSALTQHAMLATQLNDQIKSGRVKKGSVVQLIDYICSTVQNRKIIVVLNMETIIPDCEIVGNPRMCSESDTAAQKTLPNTSNGNGERTINSSIPVRNPVQNTQSFQSAVGPQYQQHSVRLTGSKLATPITAPTITPSTTPPATILRRKFLREGDTPDPAASATSGITIEAVRAAAVSPVMAFSLREALTSNFPPDFDAPTKGLFFDSLAGSGLKKHSAGFLCAEEAVVNGIAIETAEVEAIFVLTDPLGSDVLYRWASAKVCEC